MRALALILALWAGAAGAVQPSEMLDDPVLEARAREISAGLRCPVCRNESIDESNSDLSQDIRLMVRERLLAGDSNEAVVAAVVARYGEYALLRPDTSGSNIILWVAGPAMLLAGLGIGLVTVRRRAAAPGPAPLNAKEEARLKEILKP